MENGFTNTIAPVKKAQQRIHFLCVLRENNLYWKMQLAFYDSSMESVLSYCYGVWYTGVKHYQQTLSSQNPPLPTHLINMSHGLSNSHH